MTASEFLGHQFTDGKCVNCRAVESSARQFQTACQVSVQSSSTLAADSNRSVAASVDASMPGAGAERPPGPGNAQPSISPQVALVVVVLALVVAFFAWRAIKGGPADNATITSTVEQRLLASFPADVLCPDRPVNDISRPTGVQGTALRVAVQRSAVRESPNRPPATRATVTVSGSTTITWGIGMWHRAPPPSRCDFNQTWEILLRQDEFGAWQAERCGDPDCVDGFAHRL